MAKQILFKVGYIKHVIDAFQLQEWAVKHLICDTLAEIKCKHPRHVRKNRCDPVEQCNVLATATHLSLA